MTVREAINLLEACPDDTVELIMSIDPEGNGYVRPEKHLTPGRAVFGGGGMFRCVDSFTVTKDGHNAICLFPE